MTYSDLQAIYSLLSRYGALLDRLEVEEWLDLFSEDAVLDIGGELLDSRASAADLPPRRPGVFTSPTFP